MRRLWQEFLVQIEMCQRSRVLWKVQKVLKENLTQKQITIKKGFLRSWVSWSKMTVMRTLLRSSDWRKNRSKMKLRKSNSFSKVSNLIPRRIQSPRENLFNLLAEKSSFMAIKEKSLKSMELRKSFIWKKYQPCQKAEWKSSQKRFKTWKCSKTNSRKTFT